MSNIFKPNISTDVNGKTIVREIPPASFKVKEVNGDAEKEREEEEKKKGYEEMVVEKWDEMDLPEDILRGIYAYGYEIPSPIQKKAVMPMRSGRDLIAQAQSGTGKTATFVIGSLCLINPNSRQTQVICLAPTRELAIQIASVFSGISQFMNGIRIDTMVGGMSVDKSLRSLRTNPPHIVVGTTGRVFDMISRRALRLDHVRVLLLDEADEMLSSGFKDQVRSIFEYLPEQSQTCIFSATLPPYIFDVTGAFMKDPLRLIVKAEQLTLEGISQHYIPVADDMQKYDALIDLYGRFSVSHCIIYTNSVKRVEDLYQAMVSDGYPVCCMHSNMSKDEREESMSAFRSGTYRVLISSNMTARGIDIQQVSCVINFDIPRDVSTYLHRIGRSGRWGRKGSGINLITERDVPKMREIEQYYSTQITEMPDNIVI
jgi:translation initiation factor 4A